MSAEIFEEICDELALAIVKARKLGLTQQQIQAVVESNFKYIVIKKDENQTEMPLHIQQFGRGTRASAQPKEIVDFGNDASGIKIKLSAEQIISRLNAGFDKPIDRANCAELLGESDKPKKCDFVHFVDEKCDRCGK